MSKHGAVVSRLDVGDSRDHLSANPTHAGATQPTRAHTDILTHAAGHIWREFLHRIYQAGQRD